MSCSIFVELLVLFAYKPESLVDFFHTFADAAFAEIAVVCHVALHDEARYFWAVVFAIHDTLAEVGNAMVEEYLEVVVAHMWVMIEASVVLPCDTMLAEFLAVVGNVLVGSETEVLLSVITIPILPFHQAT